MPETFSSEIGDVPRTNEHPSFTDEFRGASDSLIERDRPPRPTNVGRRGRRIALVLVLLTVCLGGGGWALWTWSGPIGEWIASWRAPELEANPAEPGAPEPALSEPISEPATPDRAPDGAETPPTPAPTPTPTPTPTVPVIPPAIPPPVPGELPVEPLDGPSRPPEPAVTVATTTVRGRVASSSVGSQLHAVDTALEGCWTSAATKPETKRPTTLTLDFTIKWNGRLVSTTVVGDAPESVGRCVRTALPSHGWPQPRDGGEARVTRTWTLE